MKTLIIIAIILFFAWLYRIHREIKKQDRELQAWEEKQNEKTEEIQQKNNAFFYKLSRYNGSKRFVKTGRNNNK